MKALAKRVDDIEQSMARRTKKMSDVDSRKISEELQKRADVVFDRVWGLTGRKEVSVPSIPREEPPCVVEESISQETAETPIADVPLQVEVRQEDNRVHVTFTVTPDDRERLKVAAKEREITEEELLCLFVENLDFFVPFPPKTAGHIRKASTGQRRAAHRLVEQVLRKGFSRFDWH